MEDEATLGQVGGRIILLLLNKPRGEVGSVTVGKATLPHIINVYRMQTPCRNITGMAGIATTFTSLLQFNLKV